jgi:ABC-type antimicrobial peptide transport system permease subunit
LEGRALNEQDLEDSRKVAVINQKMAEQFWHGENSIGKRFSVGGAEGPFWEVVGVSKTGYYVIPGEPPTPFFYRPFEQAYRSQQTLFVHAQAEPTSLLPAIREEIRALDPDMPVFDVRTLESHVKEGKAVILFHLPGRLVGAFAVIGALLAALGLYGVIAYSVTQRSHEIGVRVALGASSGSVVRLFLAKGVLLGTSGIVLGIVLAIAVTSTFGYLLVGISAKDPATYAGVSLLVMLAALTACFIPARFRAARIDPFTALRDE